MKQLSSIVFLVTFDLETGNVEGQDLSQGLQRVVLIKAYMHVEFERVILKYCALNGPKPKFAFDLETGNVEGQSQRQGLQ